MLAGSLKTDLFSLKAVSDTLGLSRSNLHERVSGKTKPHRRYHKAQDAAFLPLTERPVSKGPTYGYQRITAVLNRKLRANGQAQANHKRAYRIRKTNKLLLAQKYAERPEQAHDCKVVVIRSNLHWLSEGFDFTCWNGGVVRDAFIIDAHDREVMAWRVVVNAVISGSDIREMMLAAKDARISAGEFGLRRCFTPLKSPLSNGVSEVFVQTLKRDYVRVTPLLDAKTALELIDD